jgi:hypothetical protein
MVMQNALSRSIICGKFREYICLALGESKDLTTQGHFLFFSFLFFSFLSVPVRTVSTRSPGDLTVDQETMTHLANKEPAPLGMENKKVTAHPTHQLRVSKKAQHQKAKKFTSPCAQR